MFQINISAFAFCILISSLAAGSEPAEEPPKIVVETKQVIEVDVNISVPQAYLNDSGDFTGFEIDRLEKIARDEDWELKYNLISAPRNRFDGVREGKCQILIGGHSITSLREAEGLDFSYPSVDTGQSIVIPFGEAKIAGHYYWSVLCAFCHWEMLLLGCCILILSRKAFGALKNVKTSSEKYGGALITLLIAAGIAANGGVQERLNLENQLFMSIQGPEDLMGYRVATKGGTTAVDAIVQYGAIPVEYPTVEEALEAMINGDDNIQAVVFDTTVLEHYASNGRYGSIRIVGRQFNLQKYGFVVAEGNELLETLNRQLIKQDEDGTTEALRRRYYGK